jgi:tetratricopeptide (TPR) repeat protein
MSKRWGVPALVAALAVLAFSPALDHQFLNWDDDKNLLHNPNFPRLGWMLTAVHLGHYHPLTWLSLALDHAFWGLDPKGYHLTNLLLHAANAVLFYWVARRLLGGREWAAAVAALVFAVHPLRVESVAWVSERRDVLSGFFYLVSILSWLRAVQQGPRRKWLAVSLAAFTAALLSKVIVVSLPVALLVLDFYPLRRRAWAEKIPYFVLAAAAALATAALQPAGVGGLAGHVAFQAGLRIALSLYGLAFYLEKTLLPIGLYPQYVMAPEISLSDWRLLLGGAAVAGITLLLLVWRRRWPAVLAVWVCYAASLAPVLSLVRLDPQQYVADHHTYLAALGLALLAGHLLSRQPVLAALVVAALAVLSWRQTGFWRDSLTLWTRAVEGAPYSATAHNNLGEALAAAGRLPDAAAAFRRAIELRPRYATAHHNLGQALQRQGQIEAALDPLRRAAELEPAYAPALADALYNLGNHLQGFKRFPEAIEHYGQALRLNPQLADAHNNWGVALDNLGKGSEALPHYRRALELDPRHADAHNNLGLTLELSGQRQEAITHYREALRFNPRHAGAAANLARHLPPSAPTPNR